jgi:hypothetical protein
MQHIITIKNTTIATEKIVAITNDLEDNYFVIDYGGHEPLDFKDESGELYKRVMKEWQDYLADKLCKMQEAIQYGIILSTDRGWKL